MRILLDTNVLLDVFLHRDPWYKDSKKVLDLCSDYSIYRGYVTAKSVIDVTYFVQKAENIENAKKARNIIYAELETVDTSADNLYWAERTGAPDFEDAVLAERANNLAVDYIVTRNVKDFGDSFIKAVTPEKFLELEEDNLESPLHEIRDMVLRGEIKTRP